LCALSVMATNPGKKKRALVREEAARAATKIQREWERREKKTLARQERRERRMAERAALDALPSVTKVPTVEEVYAFLKSERHPVDQGDPHQEEGAWLRTTESQVGKAHGAQPNPLKEQEEDIYERDDGDEGMASPIARKVRQRSESSSSSSSSKAEEGDSPSGSSNADEEIQELGNESRTRSQTLSTPGVTTGKETKPLKLKNTGKDLGPSKHGGSAGFLDEGEKRETEDQVAKQAQYLQLKMKKLRL